MSTSNNRINRILTSYPSHETSVETDIKIGILHWSEVVKSEDTFAATIGGVVPDTVVTPNKATVAAEISKKSNDNITYIDVINEAKREYGNRLTDIMKW